MLVKIVEIPKEVKCHSEPMQNGLYIVQCSAQTKNKITTCIFYNGSDESPETPVITASNSQINCTLYNLTMVSEERNITFLIYANVTGNDTDTQFGTNLTHTIRKDCYKRFKMHLRRKKIRENGDAKNKEDTYCTIDEARIMALEIQNSKNVLCIVNY
ncbi:hypothetical protein Bpfe_003635 [Biomphalaria pfeifferi]|uniref:Uncharacterized protein n=1 Tax=Biomphalaria pfeifferi TaxID=112525 RepID=A0AAD8C7K0_BIOPF|nr:hypothetical protein Bpfe_003635 [Biomphalaria pfeifferi]